MMPSVFSTQTIMQTERSMDCMNPYECAKVEVQLCPTKRYLQTIILSTF